MVLAPIVRGRKGEFKKVLDRASAARASPASRVDGEVRLLEDEIALDKTGASTRSTVVVDRLVVRHDLRERLADSIETAVALADGSWRSSSSPRSRATPTDDGRAVA